MKLRDYQQATIEMTLAAMREHRRVLVQMPTGAGKTHVAASLVEAAYHRGEKVLIVVHRIELVEQMVEKISMYIMSTHARVSTLTAGGIVDARADVIVAMIQTLSRRDVPENIKLVIIDEAHHATAAQYKTLTDNLREAHVVGFTATPARLDGQALTSVFDTLVIGTSMRELIRAGWLVASRVISVDLPDEELNKIKISRGDYDSKSVAAYMDRAVIYGEIINTYNNYARGKQAIVYAASVELAHRYAHEYNCEGISAAVLDGTMEKEIRKDIITKFRTGETKILTNYAIITEGFDVPDCQCVQLLRPTRSLTLYLQMVGRGMRAALGKKELMILDHAANVVRHGFPQKEHAWTLHGKIKRLPADVKEIDGDSREKSILHNRTHELVEMSEEDLRKRELELELKSRKLLHVDPELITIVMNLEKEGRPSYYAAYMSWRNTLLRLPTVDELRWIARRAGYHPGWVQYQPHQRER